MSDAANRLAVKLVVLAAALVLSAAVWSGGTWSAFDRSASSPGNAVETGRVTLSDNAGGAPLLSLSGARSGSSATACAKVTYGGTVPATVRMYAAVSGTGLADDLTLVVTRGTISGAPAAKSCSNFVADTTSYVSKGAGVFYSGTLAAFPGSAGSALVDPTSGAPAAWVAGDARAYKLVVTMADSSGAGQNATADFTWLATSS